MYLTGSQELQNFFWAGGSHSSIEQTFCYCSNSTFKKFSPHICY